MNLDGFSNGISRSAMMSGSTRSVSILGRWIIPAGRLMLIWMKPIWQSVYFSL